MTAMADWGFETRQVHAGAVPDPTTGARAVPIYQTTSFTFRDTAHAAALFSLQELGNIYTRIMNPTQAAFEERVASLEGGVAALALASGQAAETITLLNLAENGGHIVSSASLYGGTYNLFHYTFPKLGIETTFVENPDDLEEWAAAIRPNTKAFFAETLGNPKGDVLNFEGVSKVAHDHKIPLVVDNTLATPFLCRPFEHGADIVVHSATKFLAGHGNSLGGVVVESGKFDWSQGGRFPSLTEPEPAYHGLKFFENFGDFAFTMKARAVALRDFGPALAPMNAFLTITGVETLHVRMGRHVENARKVAEFLSQHPKVAWVSYASLKTSAHYKLAQKYLPKGAGAVFTFGVKGGFEAGVRLVEGVRLFSHLANIGDTRSLILHPASTTHRPLTNEQRKAAGAGDDVVRLSIGLETADDLIRDLDQALEG